MTVNWYCRKCWQEGSYNGPEVPDGWSGDPAKLFGVLSQHARIQSQIEGSRGCIADIHRRGSADRPRMRTRPDFGPFLPDAGEPLIIGKR